MIVYKPLDLVTCQHFLDVTCLLIFLLLLLLLAFSQIIETIMFIKLDFGKLKPVGSNSGPGVFGETHCKTAEVVLHVSCASGFIQQR